MMGHHERLFQQMQTAISGLPYDEETEQRFSDSLWLLERSIQARQGHTRADDWLFDSVFEEYAEYGVTPDAVNAALDEYYPTRGLDLATGLPRKSEYARLGLADIADRLELDYGIALSE
jgi:aldehyde:ferredoxin oxidoreductase